MYTAENIRELRRSKHMSTRAFAKLLGVSERAVQLWEQGKTYASPPVCKLMRLMEIGIDLKMAK